MKWVANPPIHDSAISSPSLPPVPPLPKSNTFNAGTIKNPRVVGRSHSPKYYNDRPTFGIHGVWSDASNTKGRLSCLGKSALLSKSSSVMQPRALHLRRQNVQCQLHRTQCLQCISDCWSSRVAACPRMRAYGLVRHHSPHPSSSSSSALW